MKIVTGSTVETTHLTNAILMYGSFATVHEIERKGEGRPVILPGVLATKESLLAALRRLLPESERGTGLIPETMLASGVDHMVWWVPPTSRAVWFNCAEVGGEKTATVPHPGLVMAVTATEWYVWAVKGNKRPGPDTKLYQAPYFNVWKEGRICVGTAKTPDGANRKTMSAWEEAFFGSYFIHPNVHAPEKLVSSGGAYKFWRDMLEGKYTKFPERMLVDRGLTLQAMFDRITKEKE